MKSIEIYRHRSSGIFSGSISPGVFVSRGLFRRQSLQSAMYFLIIRAIRTRVPTVVGVMNFCDDAMLEDLDVGYDDSRIFICLYYFFDTPWLVDRVLRFLIARRTSRITLSFAYPAMIAFTRSLVGLISAMRNLLLVSLKRGTASRGIPLSVA
ncbi:hypothetical protein PHMEG_00029320 [Phytophthora megakarya]|uniref:Uncharacterized protein n=1 Tax=Phytophthora megakarya TaxID=4795 RepID=A0A225V4J4_9STRA|nr:hypothetical protein PHMEG_00029320 [Phytophthora megakarya]